MYNVYQHWDPLKVMGVGKSYPPELYDYIKNKKVRDVFYKIAEETEEDYQKLINLLQTFNVEVIRVDTSRAVDIAKYAIKNNSQIGKPHFMQPRDCTLMAGNDFFYYDDQCYEKSDAYRPLINACLKHNNPVQNNFDLYVGSHSEVFAYGPAYLNGAMATRIGKDIYVGTAEHGDKVIISEETNIRLREIFSNYRVQIVNTEGHSDGTYCPVIPGLIISTQVDIDYSLTFPDWEVVYLPGESWDKVADFLKLKKNNNGKWWVPGQELNQDFTDYVESWMNHWVGYAEESVFDVNMIVVDKKNVIVNGYNKHVFDAFSRYGITPHICNFRHRYFWDGGLHCVTTDMHREGVMEDYFPERDIKD